MSENYEISLGINLDDSELSNIRKQLNTLTDTTHRVRIDIDNSRLLKQIEHVKKELKGLNNVKGKTPSLDINTGSLKGSLEEVKGIINEVKNSLGTLDNKTDTKSLVVAVNQIASALERATNESDGLVASLQKLANKDFSVNLGINLGGNNNSIARNAAYGNEARDVISQFKQRVNALKKQISSELNIGDESQALVSFFNFGEMIDPTLSMSEKRRIKSQLESQVSEIMNGLSPYEMADKVLSIDFSLQNKSLKEQMKSYSEVIDMIEKFSKFRGVDLSSVTSGFSESSKSMIQNAENIQTGVKETEESVERLKSIFNTGIDADSLTPIINKLEEIRVLIDNISKENPFGELTTSFNNLASSLKPLASNLKDIQDIVNIGLANMGDKIEAKDIVPDTSEVVKTAEQTGKQIGEAIEKSVKQSINLDDVIDKEVLRLMSEFGVSAKGKKGKTAFNDNKQALVSYRKERQSGLSNDLNTDENGYLTISDDVDLDDIFGSFNNASSGIRQVTSAIADNKKEVIELDSAYEDLLTDIRSINKSGQKVHLTDTIKQEWGSDYSSNRSTLGAAFGTNNNGIDLTAWISDKSWSHLIDLDLNEQDIANQLLDAVRYAKNAVSTSISGDELFKNGFLNMDDVESEIIASVNAIDAAEEKMARSSTESANTIVQNQQRIQQSYEDTLAKQKQRLIEIDNEIEDYNKRIVDPNVSFDEGQEYMAKMDTLEDEKIEILANIEKIESAFKKNENILNSFKNSLSNIGMGADEIDEVAKKISNLNVQIETLSQKKATRMINTDDEPVEKQVLDVDISGVDEYGNAIKLTQQYDMATGDLIKNIEKVSTVQQKAGTSTDTFVKQQKVAVSNLTNQAKQLHSAAISTNVNSPIKETGHLNELKFKYKEIEDAIEEMGNASSEAFTEAQIKVKNLISEYKIMRDEYRRAENVSISLKGTDFESGLKIQKEELAKFKASASDFPQITKTIRELDTAIANVGDKSSLDDFTNKLKVARAELAKVKAETIASQRKEKVGIDVSSVTSSIANIQRISPEINEFKTEINGAEVSIESLLDDLSRVNTAGDFSVINKKFNAFTKAAESAGIAITETASGANSDFEKLKSLAKEIGNTRINIFNSNDDQKIDELIIKLNNLIKEYDELYDKTKLNARQSSQLDNLVDQQDTKAIREYGKELKELVSLSNQIENMKFEVGKFEFLGGKENEIAILEAQIRSLEEAYDHLMTTFMKKASANGDINLGSVDDLDNQIAQTVEKAENRLERFKAQYADTRNELAKKIKLDVELGNFDDDLSRLYDKFDRLSGASTELYASVEQVELALKELNAASELNDDGVVDTERLIKAQEEYAAAIEKTNNLINQQAREESKNARSQSLIDNREVFQAKIDAWLEKNSAATKRFGDSLLELKVKAENADQVELNHLNKELQKIDKAAEKAGLKMQSFGDKIKSKAKEYMAYFSVAEIFMEVTQALKRMFDTVVEIDTAMTGLKRVTDLTAIQYDNMFNEMVSSAKEYGATLNDIINATTDWVRAGFDADTALGLAEITTMYQHVSDLDYDTAAENLITAYNGFKDELNTAFEGDTVASVNYIADILNELDRYNCP